MRWTEKLLISSLFAVVVSVSVPTIAAPPDLSQTIQRMYSKAVAAEKAGDYKKCFVLWQQLYILSPAQPIALLNAARAAEKTQNWEQATVLLQRYLHVADKSTANYRLAVARLSAVAAKANAAEAREVADKRVAAVREGTGTLARERAKLASEREQMAATIARYQLAGWTQVVIGGALVLGGAGAYAYAVGQANEHRATDPATADQYAAWDAPASAAVAGGIAAAASGVVTLLLTPSRKDDDVVGLHPWSGGRGLTLSARF